MHFAICWNSVYNDFFTAFIRGTIYVSRFSQNKKISTQSAGNQRLFIASRREIISSLVGTSETIRETIYHKSFCEWLAGVIDGDGSFQVSKQGYASLEITMGLEDLKLLCFIQDKLGGSIKIRSGAKAYCYRLHNKTGIINIVNCVNGLIQHSTRLVQFHRVCQTLDKELINPVKITMNRHWFTGFFDADGTITLSIKNNLPQLSIRVTNKLFKDVEIFKIIFGGNIYYDSSQNGYYQWSVQSREDVMKIYDYFRNITFRSNKSLRFYIIEEYYSLYDKKAFKQDSIHHKEFLVFIKK